MEWEANILPRRDWGLKMVPGHGHFHEQTGVCLSGIAEFRVDSDTRVARDRMIYQIKMNEKRGAKA